MNLDAVPRSLDTMFTGGQPETLGLFFDGKETVMIGMLGPGHTSASPTFSTYGVLSSRAAGGDGALSIYTHKTYWTGAPENARAPVYRDCIYLPWPSAMLPPELAPPAPGRRLFADHRPPKRTTMPWTPAAWPLRQGSRAQDLARSGSDHVADDRRIQVPSERGGREIGTVRIVEPDHTPTPCGSVRLDRGG